MEATPFPLSSRAKPRDLRFFTPPPSRHPERSTAQNYRIRDGLWRGVEEPVPSVAEGTPAPLVGRCPSELSNPKLFLFASSRTKAPGTGQRPGCTRVLWCTPLRCADVPASAEHPFPVAITPASRSYSRSGQCREQPP